MGVAAVPLAPPLPLPMLPLPLVRGAEVVVAVSSVTAAARADIGVAPCRGGVPRPSEASPVVPSGV